MEKLTVTGLILLFFLTVAVLAQATKDVKTYCQWEYFSAACAPDHVIMMESAIYGRMSLGHCVKNDYGHLGCSKDVLNYMDTECSGKRQCEFKIYDSRLRQMSDCPEELSSYLEAKYTCLKVTSAQKTQCEVIKYLKVTEPSGYIASIEAEEHGYGTSTCPWVIQASRGQSIILKMVKFANTMDRLKQQSCYEVAMISEGNNIRRVTTCDGEQAGEFVLYQSKGQELTVQLVGAGTLATLGKFVMQYQVTGCADIKAPVNATWKRDEQKLTVRCNNTDKTWYLVCKDNRWHGDLGNCSQDDASVWGIGKMLGDSKFPYGILIVVAIGVALGIFCGGLLLTCAYMYMKRRRRAQRAASGIGRQGEPDERFIVPEETFPPPPEELIHHDHPMVNYTDAHHIKGHEDCLFLTPCADHNKQVSLVYTKTKTLKPGTGTINGRHYYETPKFEGPKFV